MTIDGVSQPIGTLQIALRYFGDEDPPFSWIDLISGSDEQQYGGVAINCLNVGDAPGIDALFGKTLHFRGDEGKGAELRESVFWRPGDETLELVSLSIGFAEGEAGQVGIAIEAECFDHGGRTGINVSVKGPASVV